MSLARNTSSAWTNTSPIGKPHRAYTFADKLLLLEKSNHARRAVLAAIGTVFGGAGILLYLSLEAVGNWMAKASAGQEGAGDRFGHPVERS